MAINIPLNWGKIYHMASTDATMNYILKLIRQKNDSKYMMTAGVCVNIENMNTTAEKLANTYKAISIQYPNSIIYTVLNSQSLNGVSHQNWLCLDLTHKKMIRFEPTDDYTEFQTKEFCQQCINIFNPTIEYKLINPKLLKNTSLQACRPISTYLASMHLSNTALYEINNIKSFTYTFQQQISEHNLDEIKCLNRETRSSKLYKFTQ